MTALATPLPPPPAKRASNVELTDDEIDKRLGDDTGLEYIDGRFVEKGMSLDSAEVGSNVNAVLHPLKRRGFMVLDQTLTYRCFPDAARERRRPDASIMRVSRLEDAGLSRRARIATIPADVAIEVVSPTDTAAELQTKIVDFLDAGFGQVWVLYPASKILEVHEKDKATQRLAAGDVLRAGDRLDGFEVAVADFFEEAQ